MKGRRTDRPARKSRRPRESRPKRTILVTTALLLAASSVIAALIRFEKDIPPLLAQTLPKADMVRVENQARRVSLIRGGEIYRSYRASLGRDPLGHKQREGDLRTPEGAVSSTGATRTAAATRPCTSPTRTKRTGVVPRSGGTTRAGSS